jgi:hypothetical protein
MPGRCALGRGGREDRLDVERDGDLVAEQHAAGLEGRVVGEAEVLAVDDRGGRRAELGVAVGVAAEAAELDVERDGLGDAADGELAVDLRVSTRTAVETKSMVGWFSASKKSFVRRCWSRFGSLVSIEAMVAWAFTELCSGVAPVTISASKSLNVPLTLLIMMWRMLKPIELWVLSMVQVPAM